MPGRIDTWAGLERHPEAPRALVGLGEPAASVIALPGRVRIEQQEAEKRGEGAV